MYFSKFPKTRYKLADNGEKIVTDIFRRIKVRDKIKNNISMYDRYDVDDGESPEIVAYKLYGSTEYFWIVCLMNNIVNRFYDWPLPENEFQQYVADKYANPDAIHHYEKLQSSGKQSGEGPSDYSQYIEVNSTELGAQSVSNIEYERRLQDEKRQIRVLVPTFLGAFTEEFDKLIRR